MTIAEVLGDSRPVLSDGAIGTMLQAAGLMPGASPEIWNVEHEDRSGFPWLSITSALPFQTSTCARRSEQTFKGS